MHQHSNYRGPEEEEKKKGYEKIFEEIIVEDFSNMEKEIVNQVQEVQRILYKIDYFLFHVGEIFNSNLFKNFLIPFLFYSFSSGTPIIWMFVHLILFQRSLRLFSVLFILFTLFCSSEVISSISSSSSLIHSSASDILLLIPSRVFLISVIVLFVSVCLFFNSFCLFNWFLHFPHFVFKVFDDLYYHYPEFFFR